MILESKNHPSNKPIEAKVIRVYDGTDTLTDLRTGFSNDVNITPEEFKLLLFAGLPDSFRKVLND